MRQEEEGVEDAKKIGLVCIFQNDLSFDIKQLSFLSSCGQ